MEELAKVIALNNELNTALEKTNTENMTLIAKVNESVETIRKIETDKAGISKQLEDAHNGMNHLQAELSHIQTKVEANEKDMEGVQSKIKEHENRSEGKITKFTIITSSIYFFSFVLFYSSIVIIYLFF